MNANRFAPTTIRPAAGRGAAVQAGYPMVLAMKGQNADCCKTDPHLPVVPASLWLEGYEDQMHPGEGSA